MLLAYILYPSIRTAMFFLLARVSKLTNPEQSLLSASASLGNPPFLLAICGELTTSFRITLGFQPLIAFVHFLFGWAEETKNHRNTWWFPVILPGIIVGAGSTGKSTLLNALLGQRLLPTSCWMRQRPCIASAWSDKHWLTIVVDMIIAQLFPSLGTAGTFGTYIDNRN